MSLEEDIDDSGEAVVVIRLMLILRLGQMQFILANSLLHELIVAHLNLKLLLEKFAVRSCPNSVFLNNIPQLFVLKEGFPFRLFQNI